MCCVYPVKIGSILVSRDDGIELADVTPWTN